MTELLSRLFIKNRNEISDPAVKGAYGTMASVVGIVLNLILSSLKFIVGTLSGAISISADAVNNLSDAGSQLISLVSFRLAMKPADRDHPFGHARIEYVASMIVSFLILHVGFDLFTESIGKLFNPEAPSKDKWIFTVAVLVVSISGKLWLGIFNKKLGGRIDSSVMKATAADSISDALSTTAVLIGILLYLIFDWVWVDAVMGIGVSVLILVAGLKIMIETMNSILGEKPNDELVKNICLIVKSYPDALGIHDMAVHNYGSGISFASLHVEVDGKRDIFELHDVIDNIENDLKKQLGIEAVIHMDPIVTDDEKINRMKKTVTDCVRKVDERLQIHDFRYVHGTTHINLIFDIAVPFEIAMSNDEIMEGVRESVAKEYAGYNCVMKVDRQ